MYMTRPISKTEAQDVAKSFHGAYATRDNCLFVLGVTTGLRVSELLSLKISDVYNSHGIKHTIHIQRKYTKGGYTSRTIPLVDAAKQAIAEHLNVVGTHRPEAPLFESQRKGRAIDRTRAHQILKTAYLANGITDSVGCHGMRKAFADNIYERTSHDIVAVQEMLGHKSEATTAIYLRYRSHQAGTQAVLAQDIF
jgi:integrase